MTQEKQSIAAAILAGGQARRMAGANKATLRIGSRTMIDRQLALLRQVADPVFVVSGRSDRSQGVDQATTIVPDLLPGTGPLGGIYTALVSSPHPRTLVIACDMPFLTLPLLQMLTRPSDADVVIPRSTRGYEALCATWSAAAADVLRRRIARGELKAALVVEDLRAEELGPDLLATCDPDGLLFVNVNTPHDYERAQEVSRLKSTK
jgi:molybdenum cofactor guanylyltransferase